MTHVSRKTLLRWLVGLAISGIFMWLVVRTTNLQQVAQTVTGSQKIYLIPTTLSIVVATALRALRWQLCFSPQDKLTYTQSASAYGAGSIAGQVIPARLGDLIRVYVLGQFSSASASKGLGTLVVERLSDMFAVVIFLAVLLPLFSLPSWIKLADGFAAAVAVVALVIVYLLARRGEDLREPGWISARHALHVGFGLLRQILDGFSAVKDPRRAVLILLVSFAVWAVQVLTYSMSFQAVHIPLGTKEGALMTFVLALTAIIPTGPGYAGSFELAAASVLGMFSVDRAVAIGYLEFTRIPTLLGLVIFAAASLLALKFSRPALAVGSKTASAELRSSA